MVRFFLVVLAIFFLVRIVRGIIAFFFPPVDRQGAPPVNHSDGTGQVKQKEYKDVQDAKFKDL